MTPTAVLVRWIEATLVLLLVVQAVRLIWVILTPVGMFGDWTARQPAIPGPAARQALFSAFDPFFREAPATGGAQVTSLALQLFGTRINEGSGQGSAIIATPDGTQSSFGTGDEIMPGVILKSVAYDHVVIDRGGSEETLFLDQSAGGGGSAGDGNEEDRPGGGGAGSANGTGTDQPLTPDMLVRDVALAPRMDGGRVTGVVVTAKGPGQGFAKAGFQPGDIITQINGRPITSAGDIQALQGQLKPGARVALMVERGAATVPLAVILGAGAAR